MTEQGLKLGDVLAEAKSRLSELQPDLPASFRFLWMNVPFTARVEQGETELSLHLCADLCPLPFTSESRAERRRLLALAEWGAENGRVRIRLSETKRLLLLGETGISDTGELTGVKILAAAAAFLLRLKPYLEVVRARPA